jgi:hypothetical protein
MPRKHKNPTIAFRPSEWERALIEERALLSGMYKKDFIARSCIYSNIVVVGKKENIEKIIDEMQIMESVMNDIAEQIALGNIPLKDDRFCDMRNEFLSLVLTVIDIMRGAAYLFHRENRTDGIDWKQVLKYTDDDKGKTEVSV